MKGQLKIQQMAFMLIAVTLFFALVGLFVIVVKFSGLKEAALELEEENAMSLVAKLANSPEFSCGKAFGTDKVNCVDADKLMMLKENIEKYEDFWGVSNIELRVIYPEENSDVACSLDNYPNCGIIRLRDSGVSGFDASNFVISCRKDFSDEDVYDKCEIAKLMVSYG